MIPEPYLREAHLRIVRDIVAGSLAGDSTGYSGNRFVRWFSIRHDRTETKRGWIKLHSIIDISTRAILDYHVTDGYAADITSMWPMMDRLGEAHGDGNLFCLDSAYLARLLCDEIANRGWTPRILPKSNTTCNNGGSQAWGDMTRTHRDDLDRFISEYHQRSIIEAVFGAIKKMYGNHLPGQEALARAETGGGHPGHRRYNIEVVARSARKKRQAHTRVAHYIWLPDGRGSRRAITVGEPAHHPLDRTEFYGFGQPLRPTACRQFDNPENFGDSRPVECQRMVVWLCLWDTARLCIISK